MEIILGTDIKTMERIPNQPLLGKENISLPEDDTEGELVVIWAAPEEIETLTHLVHFNFTYQKSLILRGSTPGYAFIVSGIQQKTLDRYKFGEKVYLGIIDQDKKIIARYEI